MTKRGLIGVSQKLVIPPEARKRLYQAALNSARELGTSRDTVFLHTVAETMPIGMPLQLGYKKARTRISVKVEVIGEDPVDKIPD